MHEADTVAILITSDCSPLREEARARGIQCSTSRWSLMRAGAAAQWRMQRVAAADIREQGGHHDSEDNRLACIDCRRGRGRDLSGRRSWPAGAGALDRASAGARGTHWPARRGGVQSGYGGCLGPRTFCPPHRTRSRQHRKAQISDYSGLRPYQTWDGSGTDSRAPIRSWLVYRADPVGWDLKPATIPI